MKGIIYYNSKLFLEVIIMKCSKCGSENVNVQAVTITETKHHGCIWWTLIGWWWVSLKWIFFFLPALIIKAFSKQKTKSTTHSEAICQNCGNRWNV